MCGICIHCLFMGQDKYLKPMLEKYSKRKNKSKIAKSPTYYPSSPSYEYNND